MNSVNIIGRACDKPSLRYTATTNRPVAEFTLAYDDPYNKDPNTGKFKAYFFLIVIWGNKAEIAAKHITKGQKVGITGHLTQEQFIPKDSTKPITKTRIIGESLDLLERPQPRPSSPPPEEKTYDIPEDEQIPF